MWDMCNQILLNKSQRIAQTTEDESSFEAFGGSGCGKRFSGGDNCSGCDKVFGACGGRPRLGLSAATKSSRK